MKVLSWIIALLGLWEFGDIAALFVPAFGRIPTFVWNHIIVGLILVIAGTWAALTSSADTARRMHWVAVAAGLWLVIGSIILRYPVFTVGLWNDVIVGGIASILGIWAVFATPRGLG